MPLIPIESIDVNGRSRKTMGDVAGLASSIERLGLLHPVVVTPEHKLIVGRRRIEAFKRLGRDEIPANVARNINELMLLLDAERDENSCREAYTPEEIVHLGGRFEEVERKAAKERQAATRNSGTSRPGKLPEREIKVDTRDAVGRAAGVSGKTYEKAKAVVKSGDRALIDEMNRTGKVNGAHKKLLREQQQVDFEEAARKAAAVSNWKPDVRCCDMETLLSELSDVDAIITDPPYPQEFLPLYGTLAKLAAAALTKNGTLAVMCGQSYLPKILELMTAHMPYRWTFAYLTPGGQSVQLWNRQVITFWKPVLIFGNSGKWAGDVIKSDVNDNDKRFHGWGQSESGMARLVEALTKPGQMVCDPFLGAGTTGVACVRLARNFIGCDVQKNCVSDSIKRMRVERQNGNPSR